MFCFVFPFRGDCVTLKEFPKFVLLEVSYSQGAFQFKHPDLGKILELQEDSLTFNEDNLITSKMGEERFQMLHCGLAADAWFSELLNGLEGKTDPSLLATGFLNS